MSSLDIPGDDFARKLRPFGVSTIFTTRKLRSCLPSLKGNFSESLKSRVVYSITCPGKVVLENAFLEKVVLENS